MRNKKKSSKWAIWLIVVVIAIGIGGVAGYQYANQDVAVPPVDQVQDPNKTEPVTPPADPQPTTEPAKNEPQPAQPAPEPSGDVISFKAFEGSGSLPLDTEKYTNNAFKLERIEWSESSHTIYVIGKMRAFEAVGYMRVRDGNNLVILEPESVIRAPEGAPAWSEIKGAVPLSPEYKGKTLSVEFFIKSPKDGSRVDLLRVKIKPE